MVHMESACVRKDTMNNDILYRRSSLPVNPYAGGDGLWGSPGEVHMRSDVSLEERRSRLDGDAIFLESIPGGSHDPARYNIKSMVPSYGLLLFILILNEGRNTS